MPRRIGLVLTLLVAVVVCSQQTEPTSAQARTGATIGTATSVPRAIRRDVPLTNAIRRAFDAGTRDLSGRPGSNYWQLQTDYTINARLDPATQTITGTETITLHNNSPQPMPEILLRLDHNIYRGLVPRGGSIPAENTEGMVLTRLSVNGEAVDLAAAPAGGGRGAGAARRMSVSGLDQTLARVALGTPVAPRSTAKIEIAWRTKLPGGPNGRGHRMTQRFDDTLFQPTQWFPRVAKYDDLRGWDTNIYLGPAEFYNNFGRFDVRIDVPAGWIVSGTGVLQNPQDVLTAKARERLTHVLESDAVITIVGPDEVGPGQSTAAGDRLVWHFMAEMVNDFAWATAKNFVWRATRATIPGKGPVPIYMVHLPERANLFANAGPITRHALEFYSKLWAPYPFPQLTLQDGPSSGMEYPMVINSNQGAADHEAGHQWWPMMVGNNETWYGWMDEGFNQYMNILSEADERKMPANLNGLGQSYGSTSGDEHEPPMMWNANNAGTMYGFQTYAKTPLMLSMLGGIVGDEAVQRAMSTYTKIWAFKHPSPWDYIFLMNSELKQDLNWFWYYWLWTTESVDGAIANVTTSGSRTTVTVRQDGQMPSPVVLKVQLAAAGPAVKPMANARMVNDTTAIVTWPVDVWFSGSRTFDAALDFGGRTITTITLDPSCRFPDRQPNDNVWPKPAAGAPPASRASLCGG
ncbi:MAG TPA: M1 family metallopeptidase [Vicinamibacterales bacterium]|nr:M1 family metallopeptidase [Vicinamibacterales bacterium]